MKIHHVRRGINYSGSQARIITDGSDYEEGRQSDTGSLDLDKLRAKRVYNVQYQVKSSTNPNPIKTAKLNVVADPNVKQTMTKMHKINSHLAREANESANNLFLGSKDDNAGHRDNIEARAKALYSNLSSPQCPFFAKGGIVTLNSLDFDVPTSRKLHAEVDEKTGSIWAVDRRTIPNQIPPVLEALNASLYAFCLDDKKFYNESYLRNDHVVPNPAYLEEQRKFEQEHHDLETKYQNYKEQMRQEHTSAHKQLMSSYPGPTPEYEQGRYDLNNQQQSQWQALEHERETEHYDLNLMHTVEQMETQLPPTITKKGYEILKDLVYFYLIPNQSLCDNLTVLDYATDVGVSKAMDLLTAQNTVYSAVYNEIGGQHFNYYQQELDNAANAHIWWTNFTPVQFRTDMEVYRPKSFPFFPENDLDKVDTHSYHSNVTGPSVKAV